MASENEASCESDPNFAVICAFLEKFGILCGLNNVDFLELQTMLENTETVHPELIDLHIKLLRKAKKSVSNDRWEKALIKLCHTYSNKDAWEIERFGYKNTRIGTKIHVLKLLLEMQFDFNPKFKNEINKMSAAELRTQPLGKDKQGHAYWYQCDENCTVRVYKEDVDEETLTLVAKDRDGLVTLLSELSGEDYIKIGSEVIINEDSSSIEIEKPAPDTGQLDKENNKILIQNDSSNDKIDTGIENPNISFKTNEETTNEKIETKPHIALKDETVGSSNTKDMTEDESQVIEDKQKNISDKKIECKVNVEELTAESNVKSVLLENTKSVEDKEVKLESTASINPNNLEETEVNSKNKKIIPIETHKLGSKDFTKNKREVGNSKKLDSIALNLSSIAASKLALPSTKVDISNISSKNENLQSGLDLSIKPQLKLKPLNELMEKPLIDISIQKKRPTLENIEPSNFKRPHLDYSVRSEQRMSTKIEESPIIGEAIEEPVMFINGEGSGKECLGGNESLEEKNDKPSDKIQKANSQGSNSEEDNNSKNQVIHDDAPHREEISPSKSPYKLGTIVDVKTSEVKTATFKDPSKKSRWDVGKPSVDSAIIDKPLKDNNGSDNNIEKSDNEKLIVPTSVTSNKLICDSSATLSKDSVKKIINKSDNSSKVDIKATGSQNDTLDEIAKQKPQSSMFFFGPKCVAFKPQVCSITDKEINKATVEDNTSEDCAKDRISLDIYKPQTCIEDKTKESTVVAKNDTTKPLEKIDISNINSEKSNFESELHSEITCEILKPKLVSSVESHDLKKDVLDINDCPTENKDNILKNVSKNSNDTLHVTNYKTDEHISNQDVNFSTENLDKQRHNTLSDAVLSSNVLQNKKLDNDNNKKMVLSDSRCVETSVKDGSEKSEHSNLKLVSTANIFQIEMQSKSESNSEYSKSSRKQVNEESNFETPQILKETSVKSSDTRKGNNQNRSDIHNCEDEPIYTNLKECERETEHIVSTELEYEIKDENKTEIIQSQLISCTDIHNCVDQPIYSSLKECEREIKQIVAAELDNEIKDENKTENIQYQGTSDEMNDVDEKNKCVKIQLATEGRNEPNLEEAPRNSNDAVEEKNNVKETDTTHLNTDKKIEAVDSNEYNIIVKSSASTTAECPKNIKSDSKLVMHNNDDRKNFPSTLDDKHNTEKKFTTDCANEQTVNSELDAVRNTKTKVTLESTCTSQTKIKDSDVKWQLTGEENKSQKILHKKVVTIISEDTKNYLESKDNMSSSKLKITDEGNQSKDVKNNSDKFENIELLTTKSNEEVDTSTEQNKTTTLIDKDVKSNEEELSTSSQKVTAEDNHTKNTNYISASKSDKSENVNIATPEDVLDLNISKSEEILKELPMLDKSKNNSNKHNIVLEEEKCKRSDGTIENAINIPKNISNLGKRKSPPKMSSDSAKIKDAAKETIVKKSKGESLPDYSNAAIKTDKLLESPSNSKNIGKEKGSDEKQVTNEIVAKSKEVPTKQKEKLTTNSKIGKQTGSVNENKNEIEGLTVNSDEDILPKVTRLSNRLSSRRKNEIDSTEDKTSIKQTEIKSNNKTIEIKPSQVNKKKTDEKVASIKKSTISNTSKDIEAVIKATTILSKTETRMCISKKEVSVTKINIELSQEKRNTRNTRSKNVGDLLIQKTEKDSETNKNISNETSEANAIVEKLKTNSSIELSPFRPKIIDVRSLQPDYQNEPVNSLQKSSKKNKNTEVKNLNREEETKKLLDSLTNEIIVEPVEEIHQTRRSTRSSGKILGHSVEPCKEFDKKRKSIESKVDAKIDRIPVVEPQCIKKHVPLLTVIDINKLRAPLKKDVDTTQEQEIISLDSLQIPRKFIDAGDDEDDDDDSVIDITDQVDTIDYDEDKDKKKNQQKPQNLTTLSLDFDELIPTSIRITRKRARASPEPPPVIEESKRPKMRGKRTVDVTLRKSIEEKKRKEGTSSPEPEEKALKIQKSKNKADLANAKVINNVEEQRTTRSRRSLNTINTTATTVSLPKAKQPKKPTRGKRSIDSLSNTAESEIISLSSEDDKKDDIEPPIKKVPLKRGRKKKSEINATQEETITPPIDNQEEKLQEEKPKEPRKPKAKKKTLLGLEISVDQSDQVTQDFGVRQSRRLAQIKIKEEAERGKIEDMGMDDKSTKGKKAKKTEEKVQPQHAEKRKRIKNITTEDDATKDAEPEENTKKKRRRKKKHKNFLTFDETKAWKSSSESSSSAVEEEDEDIVEYSEEEERHEVKSDHEFSPESDLENAEDVQPMKRARTARKDFDVEDVDKHACKKCSKSDHPEWILLCDGCDSGWHCSCLRPALLVIPEGDWYCPPCQHKKLVENLQQKLVEYDKKVSKHEMEVRRKERLAYVGISLDNVLPTKDKDDKKKRTIKKSESESESEYSSSSSDSDEPIYRLRQRNQAHSYRFNEYDDLINSAIQGEYTPAKVKTPKGIGKDINTIINAEKEERENSKQKELDGFNNENDELPPVVPKNTNLPSVISGENSEEEVIKTPKNRFLGRKKQRKLNNLDLSSDDDAESDEDFKGVSSDEDEDEFDEGSASSDEFETRRGKRRHENLRRSTRARVSRYDKRFINDDSEDDAPRRKKKSAWASDTETEESDGSWGRRRKSKKSVKSFSSRKKKAKKSRYFDDDSDLERYKKKKKSKVKYGGLEEDNGNRRTRGKKIDYGAVLASDSDEEDTKKKNAGRLKESDDEYVANEEEDEQEVEEKDSEEPNDSDSNDVPQFKRKVNPRKILDDDDDDDDEDKEEINKNQQKVDTKKSSVLDDEADDIEDDVNPIEEINKNLEEMDEKEMEMMMEEEEYANKQLQLVALQIEKEKKRKEREALKQQKKDKELELQKQLEEFKKFAEEEKIEPPPDEVPLEFDKAEQNALSNSGDEDVAQDLGRFTGKDLSIDKPYMPPQHVQHLHVPPSQNQMFPNQVYSAPHSGYGTQHRPQTPYPIQHSSQQMHTPQNLSHNQLPRQPPTHLQQMQMGIHNIPQAHQGLVPILHTSKGLPQKLGPPIPTMQQHSTHIQSPPNQGHLIQQLTPQLHHPQHTMISPSQLQQQMPQMQKHLAGPVKQPPIQQHILQQVSQPPLTPQSQNSQEAASPQVQQTSTPQLNQPSPMQQPQQEIQSPQVMHPIQSVQQNPLPLKQPLIMQQQILQQKLQQLHQRHQQNQQQMQHPQLQAGLLQKQPSEPSTPKKRGRKPKTPTQNIPKAASEGNMHQGNLPPSNEEISEPTNMTITPRPDSDSQKKRKGRGKGKKTLAAEAAANGDKDSPPTNTAEVPRNNIEGAAMEATNLSGKLGIAAPPQPFSQSQPTPSVITRMLQSQPGDYSMQGLAHKYFSGQGSDRLQDSTRELPPQFMQGSRPPLPPYRQPPPGINQYSVIRGPHPPPPHRMQIPGGPRLPLIYNTRPMGPSPSGGGLVSQSEPNLSNDTPVNTSSKNNSTLTNFKPVQQLPTMAIPTSEPKNMPSNVVPSKSSTLQEYKPSITAPEKASVEESGEASNDTSIEPPASTDSKKIKTSAVEANESVSTNKETQDTQHKPDTTTVNAQASTTIGTSSPVVTPSSLPNVSSNQVHPPTTVTTVISKVSPPTSNYEAPQLIRPPVHMMSHISPTRTNVPPYQPNIPPNYYNYPPSNTMENNESQYESSPYHEPYGENNIPSEVENRDYEEESTGEFGGLVSYFSSQQDDLEG